MTHSPQILVAQHHLGFFLACIKSGEGELLSLTVLLQAGTRIQAFLPYRGIFHPWVTWLPQGGRELSPEPASSPAYLQQLQQLPTLQWAGWSGCSGVHAGNK